MMGIARNVSHLHGSLPYFSIIENILNRRKQHLLGEKVYISLYTYNNMFMDFGRIPTEKLSSPIQWINIAEKGKLLLALYRVKLTFFEKGNVKRTLYVMHDCVKGCHLSIDTTSHFSYAPVLQT